MTTQTPQYSFTPCTAPKNRIIEIWDPAPGHRIWRPVFWSDADWCWLCAVTYSLVRPVVLCRCTHWRDVVPPEEVQ